MATGADETDRFLLGINYWPRRSAMAMWSRFDAGEIDEDFARIAALGLHVVRFFLTWEAFQPSRDHVDAAAVGHFQRVMDIADRHRLHTMPALFCGHMSGVNWLPAWTLDARCFSTRFRTIADGTVSPYGIGDFYQGALLEAQRRLARAVGESVRDHPALLAWDLGNEFSNLRAPPSDSEAATWSTTLTNELYESSSRPVTAGTHGEDLTQDRRLRLSSLAAPWPYATMHGYPVYSAFARSSDDTEVVPFLAALTRAFAAKPVLFTEFGNPQCGDAGSSSSHVGCLEEEAMPAYCSAVLDRLQRRGALGAFWWCWADYAAELADTPPFDRAPHELHFGIVRRDGSEKPVATALQRFAAERRAVAPADDAVHVNERKYYATLPDATQRAFEEYVAAHGGGARSQR